jgi:hypothetical protein
MALCIPQTVPLAEFTALTHCQKLFGAKAPLTIHPHHKNYKKFLNPGKDCESERRQTYNHGIPG